MPVVSTATLSTAAENVWRRQTAATVGSPVGEKKIMVMIMGHFMSHSFSRGRLGGKKKKKNKSLHKELGVEGEGIRKEKRR
jgi:hypothetical protein